MNTAQHTRVTSIATEKRKRMIESFVEVAYHGTTNILQNHNQIQDMGYATLEDFKYNRTLRLSLPRYQPYYEILDMVLSEISDSVVFTTTNTLSRKAFIENCASGTIADRSRHYDYFAIASVPSNITELRSKHGSVNIFIVLNEADYEKLGSILTTVVSNEFNYAVILFEQR
jgi:hypothetical protein